MQVLTTVGEIPAGSTFVFTPGGVLFEKIPGTSQEGNCLAIVAGDPQREAQSLSPNFTIYVNAKNQQ